MQKIRIKLALKFVAFVLVLCICVGAVNGVMKPKFYFNNEWPTTNTFLDFYELEKDSVDVLFLGSSHCINAFNPQVLYDEYGITSYNLASPQQNALLSYYWLEEALKYQSPKVVVLETFTFHYYKEDYVYNDMNCSEESARKAMDFMRLSPLKVRAAFDIQRYDPTQDALSYIFTNIRYHTRWKDLSEDDFSRAEMVEHGGIKGYSVHDGVNSSKKDVTFKAEDSVNAEEEPIVRVTDEYLEKIVNLCEENGIQLILTCVPYGESIGRYKSVKNYADSKNIPFYDFNEESLYKEVKYNAKRNGYNHVDYSGAEKLTSYIGGVIAEKYGVAPRKDSSFEKTREVYNHKVNNTLLSKTTDINKYLDLVNDSKYSVVMFAPFYERGQYLGGSLTKKLQSLGFKTDFVTLQRGAHYIGINDGKDVIEKVSVKDYSYSNSFHDGRLILKYSIDTSLYDLYSFEFGDLNYSEIGSTPGFKIIVYDNDDKKIIDKIYVDTSSKELPITRW
ncbi:hypothetical protein SAMN05421493_10268 [Pseudobutyrivibrio sp. 49]|uniref:hypothetical protein n=1 Tax=Pseudobutyrivibrio sp. 49 TaxID=1855344 RepID=UPI0008808114|nr:hypothetical protein [Pseudobutyrivibrio sp. 49]SDH59297.1 hypothetical protein SAMN05421493_10268 [Pseudobutyrivibrio sp. 49]